MRNHPTDRDAPAPITPPTGPYRVLVLAGGRVEVLATRPETEEGRESANKLFRGCQHPAALCRGATVVKRNGRGESHSAAFRAFAAGDVAPSAPRRSVAPARRVEPAHAPVITPRPVEPEAPVAPAAQTAPDVEPSAPSTTTDHDEEPMKTDETRICDAHECEDPRAGVRADTKTELAGFCRHHRKVAVDRVRDHGVSFAEVAAALREGRPVEAAPSKPATKPSKPVQSAKAPKTPPPSNDPGDLLFEALRGLLGEQLSDARVRAIVREELATAFTSLRGRT